MQSITCTPRICQPMDGGDDDSYTYAWTNEFQQPGLSCWLRFVVIFVEINHQQAMNHFHCFFFDGDQLTLWKSINLFYIYCVAHLLIVWYLAKSRCWKHCHIHTHRKSKWYIGNWYRETETDRDRYNYICILKVQLVESEETGKFGCGCFRSV